MADFSVKLEGAEELLSKFSQMDASRLWDQAVPPMLQEVRRTAGKYPPQPTGSRYVRKNSAGLAGAWYVKKDTLETSIGNRMDYASYVHGPDQRWYHGDHGWKQLIPTIEEYLPKIAWALTSAVARVWNR